MPCNTFRMWFLGLLWTAIISFVNQFFYLRQTQISIGYSVVALLSLPMGHFMARVLPTRQYSLFGKSFSLNPGPFSVKEHVLIGTMTACNTGTAYAVDIVILQKVFYDSHTPFFGGLLLVLTTQITGFALAGTFSEPLPALKKEKKDRKFDMSLFKLIFRAIFRCPSQVPDSSCSHDLALDLGYSFALPLSPRQLRHCH
jgi:hypothetical protein